MLHVLEQGLATILSKYGGIIRSLSVGQNREAALKH
jgi:hypothetical protein